MINILPNLFCKAFCHSQRGISIIGAVFTLLILAIFGAAMTVVVGTEQEHRRLQLEKSQAFYQTQAGLEYAIWEIVNGGHPIVSNRTIGRGDFTVGVDYLNHRITVNGASGDVTKTHSITYNPMGGDCLSVDKSAAVLSGPSRTDLNGLTLRKVCNNAVTIEQVRIVWDPNNNEKVRRITINNLDVYDNISGASSGELIDIADHKLTASTSQPINLVQFSSSMLNKAITIVFYLSDSSYRNTQFTVLP